MKTMNLIISVFLAVFKLNGAEILAEIKVNNVLACNYASYRSTLCSQVIETQYLFGNYIWHMRFLSELGNDIYGYFLAIKQKENSKNISIFTGDKTLSIDDILDQKPVAMSYDAHNGSLVARFIVSNTNDIIVVTFQEAQDNDNFSYKVMSVETYSQQELEDFITDFLKSNMKVGDYVGKHWNALNKYGFKTTINVKKNDTVEYIIYSYKVHHYGSCNNVMSIANKPVNLFIITVDNYKKILSIDYRSNCCYTS